MFKQYVSIKQLLPFYGINLSTSNQICLRSELNVFNGLVITTWQHITIDSFKARFLINSTTFKTRATLNILLLNLLTTYKGWRHSRGLPVRGQRTWSNGWSSYRSNLTLRSFKLNIAKNMYGLNVTNDYITAYLAEEVNNMWRLQWGSEWREAKRKRLTAQKNPRLQPKVDLIAMSKLDIGVVSEKSKNQSKLKQRKKGVLTLGFDPGFTKSLVSGVGR